MAVHMKYFSAMSMERGAVMGAKLFGGLNSAVSCGNALKLMRVIGKHLSQIRHPEHVDIKHSMRVE